jgi:transmembrane sensor
VAAAVAVLAFWVGGLPRSTAKSDLSHVYATSVGQRADVRLPDGTRMLVAPESRVRRAADFGIQRRDVHVEGEAYFEVVHDSTRPFTVFAANTSTRDIGTVFAVRNYADEGVVRVVVAEGKVVMSGAGPLAAGDVGRLTAEGVASVRHGANAAALVGWTHGELAFEDAPLSQVLQDLRRWYGVDARVADPALGTLPFTGSLRGVPSAQGIELVAATLGLRLVRDGAQVVLSKR